MKSIRLMIFSIISFFIFILSVHGEASNFAPMISMDPDINEGQVKVVLGFTGEEVMIINHTFSYDSSKLNMVSVSAMDNFNVEVTDETTDGKYKTVRILADSDYSFKEVEYCVITFDVLPKFKRKRSADLFVYNFEGIGPNSTKFRNTGQVMSMVRESPLEMYFTLNDITSKTKTEYWFKKYYPLLILGVVAIIGVISIILLAPSRRKQEQRDNAVGSQIKKENYDPNANFKLDQKEIEKIGVVDKPIDINQAILVNDNVKPFGDIVGKFDEEVTQTPEVTVQNDTPSDVSVFDNRTPDSLNEAINPFNMKANNVDADNTSEKLEDLGIKELEEDNLYQISSNVIEEANAPSVSELPAFNMNPVGQENTNTVDVSNLSSVMPTAPQLQSNSESVTNNSTLPEVIQNPIPPVDNNNNNNNNNPNVMSIVLFLFILFSIFSVGKVRANEYDVKSIRACILNKISFNEKYDLNDDGMCNIDDLLLTKNLVDCNYEKKMNNPEFRELQNFYKQNRTTKVIQIKERTTKGGILKTTTKATTRKATTARSTTTRGTTTKRTTTARSTTTRGTTTKRTTTARSTTTRGTTTKRTTTRRTTTTRSTTVKTTTTKAQYNVSFVGNGGTPSDSSKVITEGSSLTIYYTPTVGYVYTNSSCTSGTPSYTASSNKLIIKNVTENATCTVNFAPKSSYKILARYSLSGTSKSVSGTATYNGSTTLTMNPTGYSYKSHNCTNATGSYSNGKLTVSNVVNDATCDVVFAPNSYYVYIEYKSSIDGEKHSNPTQSSFNFDSTQKIRFASNECSFSKAICNGKSASLSKQTGTDICTYEFSLKITASNKCTLS